MHDVDNRFGAPPSEAWLKHANRQPVGLGQRETVANCRSKIELYYNDIVNALNRAALCTIPYERCNTQKYWWSQALDELKQQSIITHRAWVEANPPRQGPIFDSRCKAKAAYRNCIRQNQIMEKENVSNNLHEALINKSPDKFWKIWSSKFGTKKRLPTTIDGLHDEQDIADNFVAKFAKSCSALTKVKNDILQQKFYDQWSAYVGDDILDIAIIDAGMLDKIVSDLKFGKAAGRDNLTSEHLKYCHPIVLSMLSKLFQL